MDRAQPSIEEMIDRCVERLLDGEPLEVALSAYPEHAATLRPALESASTLVQAPAMEAPLAPRLQAMRRMLDQVEASAKGDAPAAWPALVGAFFGSFRKRPLAFQGVAAGAAIVLFGGAAIGASAATGTTPEPVRQLFGISSTSVIKVELEGIVVSVDAAAGTMVVDAGGDLRTIVVSPSTEIDGDDGDDDADPFLTLEGIPPGAFVEVKGALQPDNSILASKIDVDDDDDAQPTAAPPTATPDAVPPAVPTDDHDDDDDFDDDDADDLDDEHEGDEDDDRSGPSENSGPGNADDGEHDGDDVDDDHDDDGDDDEEEGHEEDDSSGDRDDDRDEEADD